MSATDDHCIATISPNQHEIISCWGDRHYGPHGAIPEPPCPECCGMEEHTTGCSLIGEDLGGTSPTLMWDDSGTYWVQAGSLPAHITGEWRRGHAKRTTDLDLLDPANLSTILTALAETHGLGVCSGAAADAGWFVQANGTLAATSMLGRYTGTEGMTPGDVGEWVTTEGMADAIESGLARPLYLPASGEA